MTNHADLAMRWAEGVAAEIRAEMARQRKSPTDLAAVLGLTPRTARDRLENKTTFSITEFGRVAAWLGKDPMDLTPGRAA